jgi:predicted ATPase/DNA-binding SARP family transcriptional activator
MALEFRILGALEVVRDGEPLRLAGRLRRSFVAVLVLHAGEAISVDRLIEELWPGHDEGALARLRVYVSQLRKAFGADAAVLETQPGGYALVVEPDAVDALRFERLAAVGREALAADDPERAAETLVEALALWRGAALAEFAYDSFAQNAAARLDELRLSANEDRIAAALALGRHSDLIGELEQLVRDHPLRERPRGQLMLALYRNGRQADALAAFREARRVLDEELGLEPGPELKELQRAILRQDAALRVERPELRARRHLPAPSTPIVGRERELEEVGTLLRGADVRLLTLTGAGGTGKTRLSLQVAHDLADVFPDGVYFVDLASLREDALVPAAIAAVLGLHEHDRAPIVETLKSHLHERRVMLVLDNFEVVDDAAPLLGELLAAAPRLAVLVTSRTPLRLAAEHEYRIPPLPTRDAARLFAVRARAVAPGFRRPSEESGEVAEICRRLDYLPLGIELAAARSRELTPAEMLELMPRTLDFASGDARDRPARHQTLRATIDWSYALLPADERALLARLAVFAGGCTLDAARTVSGATRSSLATIAGHSLLRERPGADGGPRFHLLETVREYAFERLEGLGETETVRRRHAEHYADLAEVAERELEGASHAMWLARLEDESANIRAAFGYCVESGAAEVELRLAGALARFWELRGDLREGRHRLAGALERGRGEPGRVRAKALAGATALALRAGDQPGMKALAGEHLALSRSLGDDRAVAQALDRLATATSNEGDFRRGAELYEQSIEISRRLDDRHRLAVSTSNLGSLALMQGEYDRARELCEEGLALFQELGATDELAMPLFNLGLAALLQGRHAEALARLRAGLELTRDLEYAGQSIHFLEGLAAAFAAGNQAERAGRLLGAAEAAAESTGVSLEPAEQEIHNRTVEAATAALGHEGFALAHAGGRTLELRQAIDYALEPTAEATEVQPLHRLRRTSTEGWRRRPLE